MALAQLISRIYWLIGRADPTDADLRGAVRQVAALIERDQPKLVSSVRNDMGWPNTPLFEREVIMNTELTVPTGQDLYRASTDAAALCKAIVTATAKKIQGRNYVQVEGWQAIATAHGCVASAGEVHRVTDEDGAGYLAIGKVIRMDNGQTIATAEGFVGDDEKTWASRPVYARRAMAQTRAISRACRSAFAHVVVMMNAGLETTPAEEVPPEGFARDMGTAEVVRDEPEQPLAEDTVTRYATAIRNTNDIPTLQQIHDIAMGVCKDANDREAAKRIKALIKARKAELQPEAQA